MGIDINQAKKLYGKNTEIRKLDGVEIMTPSGFKKASYIKRVKAQGYYRVLLSNQTEIKASESHKVQLYDNRFTYVSMLRKEDRLQQGIFVLEDPKWIHGKVDLYDFLDLEGGIYTTLQGVINHNCAFIDNIEETFAAAQQTLATGGQSLLLSTPNGFGNFFHRTWQKAETGENSFIPVKLPWMVHPERDQAWRDLQTRDLGERMAAQECIGGSSRIIIRNKITGTLENIKITALFSRLGKGPLVLNKDYEIRTPTGLQPFHGIKKVRKPEYLRFHFSSSDRISCSLEHPFVVKGEIIQAKDFKEGDFLETLGGRLVPIIRIEHIQREKTLFDILEVANGNVFFANNKLVHNCDCDFLTSGESVVDPDILTFYEQTHLKDPDEKRGVDHNLWIWEQPDYLKSYMVVADVARGDGADYSTFHVMDIEEATQVAEYKGKLSPKDFGNVLVGIASEYNDALLVVENASIGWATIEQILEREYRNLYYSPKTQTDTVESYMTKYERDQLVPGFTMSPKTRPLVIAKLMEYFSERSATVHSKRLLGELRVFVWKNGKAQAQVGYNDDLVMSFATGLYVRDTALRLRQQGVDLARAQLSSFSSINSRSQAIMTPRDYLKNDPFTLKTPGGSEDISWLL